VRTDPGTETKLDETLAPDNLMGSVGPSRVKLIFPPKLELNAAISPNDRVAARQSTKFAGATGSSVPSPVRSHSTTIRPDPRRAAA